MKKLKGWSIAALALLIIAAIWWIAFDKQEGAGNKSDTFVNSENGILHWLEITTSHGKVKGKLYQQKIIEEIGKEPFMEENEYPLTGTITENEFELEVNFDGEIMVYDASLSETILTVQQQDQEDSKVYHAIAKEELDKYVTALQQELQMAIDGSEEEEKNRLRTFFSELRSIYGYLYTSESNDLQLFIKFDEALLEGEVSGSLLMVVDTGNEKNSYKEAKYDLYGITDGLMVELFTMVDGQQEQMDGNFRGATIGMDLSFWTNGDKLFFEAVTEDEFEKSYEKFKVNVQN